MTAPANLRTLILGSTSVSAQIGTRCHYNHVPQYSARPNVWLQITSDNEDLTLDGTGGLHEAYADLECVGISESSAQAVADAVKARLHGYKGAMGSLTVQGVFVSDKDDDYIPVSNDSDDGLHVVAYTIRMFYTT